MKRRALLIATGVAAAGVVQAGVFWQRTRPRHPRFAYLGRVLDDDAHAALALDGFSPVTLSGARGALVGLVRPPAEGGAPLVVHFPGNGAAVLGEARAQLRAVIADPRVGVLVVAPTGFDGSAGVTTLRAVVEDVVPTLAYARERFASYPLVLSGFSLGALPALVARSVVEASVRTVLFAPFSTIEVGHPGPLGRVWTAETWDTREAAKSPGGPVVVVHGTRDPYFPLEMSQELVALVKPTPELVVLDDVGHLDLMHEARAREAMTRVLAARTTERP